jgi:SAM-dependent methyltransferase
MLGVMRKVYSVDDGGGQSHALWDHAWHDVDMAYESARLREGRDPLVRLVSLLAPRTGPVLEAGSGSGRVLAHLRDIGCAAVGMDFSVEALTESVRRAPGLVVTAGDITALPFHDRAFAGVVSLGLVEHFEEGPGEALREHYRVLRPGGRLLLSVPRLSPLKDWTDHRSLTRGSASYMSWRGMLVRRCSAPTVEANGEGSTFYQYEVKAHTLAGWLRSTGFRVHRIRPVAVTLGLREIGIVRKAFDRLVADGHSGSLPDPSSSPRSSLRNVKQTVYERLREIVAAERGHNAVERALARGLGTVSGHMLFAVATRDA